MRSTISCMRIDVPSALMLSDKLSSITNDVNSLKTNVKWIINMAESVLALVLVVEVAINHLVYLRRLMVFRLIFV